jgi:hypothetical protein
MLVSGTAVVTGTNGTIVFTGLATYTSLTQSISATHEAEKALVKDANGNDTTVVCCNEGYKITIHLVPADNTVANKVANAVDQAIAPPLCARVTLSGFVLPWLNDTKWVYLGGATFDMDNNSNPVRINLPIEKRVANDLALEVDLTP